MAVTANLSAGQVLTASTVNNYMINSGLVYVGGGSFTGATSFDVTGFSSTYKYYRLVHSAKRVDSNAASVLYGQLVNGTTVRNTSYYGSAFFTGFSGTTGVGYTSNNASNVVMGLCWYTGSGVTSFDIGGMTSDYMSFSGTFWDYSNARQYLAGGQHDVSETNDKIRITASAGTVTGFWRLYGYREP